MSTLHTLRDVLILAILGIALGIGYNFASTKQVPWQRVVREVETIPDDDPATEPPAKTPGGVVEAGTNGREAADPPARVDPQPLYDDLPESDYPREILLARAKAFYDRGGLVVMDAREHDEYAMGHIKGALLTPHDEKVADVAWLDEMGVRPEPILIYCDGGDCELSLNLGFAISESGHRRVLILKDGYPAWEEAGYPTATGDLP